MYCSSTISNMSSIAANHVYLYLFTHACIYNKLHFEKFLFSCCIFPLMELKIILRISFVGIFSWVLKTTAQTTTPYAHIDPSKPTNQYTHLSNNLEYNFLKSGKRTYGYRANFIWASGRQHHSLYMELPLLYATSSRKFGLSDMRFRYYWVPYKNYAKKPGAFGFCN